MSTEKPLTNLQIEILKMYGKELSDVELVEVRRLLASYFANKARDQMDELWEERGWTNETMEKWIKGEDDIQVHQ